MKLPEMVEKDETFLSPPGMFKSSEVNCTPSTNVPVVQTSHWPSSYDGRSRGVLIKHNSNLRGPALAVLSDLSEESRYNYPSLVSALGLVLLTRLNCIACN